MPEMIALRGGCIVPVRALKMLWALEDLGHELTVSGSAFQCSGWLELRSEQRQAVTAENANLVRLVRYVEGLS